MFVHDHNESERANRRYVRATMRAPVLTAEDEQDLARRWTTARDVEALQRLVSAYMRLVVTRALGFRHYGLPLGDLIQEGNIGLMMAAERFDPERGVRFSTYANWWVRSSMQDYVLRNWSIVRTGTTAAQKKLFFNLRRLKAQIGAGLDGAMSTDSVQEIARRLKVSPEDVNAMDARMMLGDQSLNKPTTEDGDQEWVETLPDRGPSPEDIVVSFRDGMARAQWLKEALETLTPRERTIIDRRRLSEEAVTLETLGRELGISKERVRQIEHKALQKLRSVLAN